MAKTRIINSLESEIGDRSQFQKKPLNSSNNTKPIMGFLYSVSRTQMGEFWPLYLGPNRIGRSPQFEVPLMESTVSENHAILVIRRMQNNGENAGLFVFLQDTGSMCGTMLNGVTLDFSPKECKSGDIISVGDNYELYFFLIDTEALGLRPKEGFSPVVQETIPRPGGMPMFTDPKGTIPGNSTSPFEVGGKKTMVVPPQNQNQK